MKEIKVETTWCDKNFSGGWGDPEIGAIIATGKTFANFKDEFQEALNFHFESFEENEIPEWWTNKDYTIDYVLDTAALIRCAEEYTSISALSRASGINAKQLSHYANGTQKPRAAQRQRIVEGLHRIAQACMALM